MAAWINLSQTLVKIDTEIRSVKQPIRNKALDKLQSLLDSRSDELAELLQGRVYQADVAWADLVDSAHEGCIQQVTRLEENQLQKGLGALEQKNPLHWNVLQKLIALANRNSINIPYTSILSKAFHCFGNRWMVQYFGMCYLQIVYRNVLTSKEDLQEVKISEWSRLLSYCFQLYEHKSMQKLAVLQCFSPVIQAGCKYTFFSSDLVQYLPNLEEIVANNLEFNALTELIKTINIFSTNLALDCRLTLCQFLENTLGTIIKAYNTRLNEDSKVIFFQLLYLSMVVHDPDPTCSANNTSYAVDHAVWHRHLRNIFHLVQTVIKQLNSQPNRLQNNPTICASFVEMGAKLCSVIFWNPLVWNEQECNSEPSQKKKRRPDKLEGLMELVEFQKGKFCWRWMSIFAHLIESQPDCVQTADLQPILQMLHDFQLTIQYPVQVIVLHRILRVLLEIEFAEDTHLINEDFFVWLKIAQTSFRTSSLNLLSENIRLLRQVISSRQTLPNVFVESIVKTLLSNSIRKSNDGVQLLIDIFRHYSVDAFGCDYREQTMKWLLKSDQVLLNFESIRVEHVAELTTLCLFSKIDRSIIRPTRILDMPDGEFCRFEETLRKHLSFKSLTKLIVCQRVKEEHNRHSDLPQPNSVKSVVNEMYFQKLFEILNPDRELEETSNSLDAFNRVTSTLVLYMQLLNSLIAYESMDKVGLSKTFLCKKAHFKVEQMDMCVGKFATFTEFTDKDAVDVIESISGVFRRDLHPVLIDVILSQQMPATVRWLRSRIMNSEPAKDSKTIAYRLVDDLNCANRLRYEAFVLLTFFEHGSNDIEAFDVIDEYGFNLNSNTDLLIVQALIKILVTQKPSVRKAEWCFNHIKSICQLYHRNQQMCQLVIDVIPDLAHFVSGFPDMTDDMIVLIASFLAQIKKKKYGPRLTQSLILAMRHVASAYANNLDTEQFRELFYVLARFLTPHGLSIQYATIETLAVVFDTEQIRKRLSVKIDLADFQRCMFGHLLIAKLTQSPSGANDGNDVVGDVDSFSRFMSVVVQMLVTIICKSHILRKDAMFLLAEFIFKHELNKDYVCRVTLMICKQLDVDHATFINENIEYLLSMWLIKNYQLARFPWFLSPSATQNDFFNDHIETLTICILRHKSEILKDFVPLISGESMTSIIEPVVAYCLAYLMPQFSKCPNMSENYAANCKGMSKLLRENVPNIKRIEKIKLVEILEHLFHNNWDRTQFQKFFKFNIDYQAEEYTIDSGQLKLCLEHMKIHIDSASTHETFVVNLCHQHPNKVAQILQTLKLRIHQSRFAEQKLVSLFQYCSFMDYVADFLVRDVFGPKTVKDKFNNIKTFLVRDATYFLGHILQTNTNDQMAADSKFVFATIEYMQSFLQRTLSKCAVNFKSCFNFIVSTLVGLFVRATASGIKDGVDATMNCLTYLVVELSDKFAEEITLIDTFPANVVFEKLHEVHKRIKYQSHSFGLTEELDCFLQVESRNSDGLSALREQLSSKKEELAIVFRNHHDSVRQTGSYEHICLHRLVLSLLESVHSSNANASLEAAKCLGELGPSDLATIVLRPDSKLHTYKHFSTFESACNHLCRVALKTLNDLLTDSNPAVVKVVCNAIESLLHFEDIQRIADVFPFLIIFQSPTPSKGPIYKTPNTKTINLECIFSEHELASHDNWLKAFVNELFQIFDDNHLSLVAAAHLAFAECMLPLLTQMVLTCDHLTGLVSNLIDCVSKFFEKHLECIQITLNSATSRSDSSIYLNRASIKAMLNVTECIRMSNLFNIHNKLKLNYLHVAKAAEYCNAHFTSILYADLWAMDQVNTEEAQSDPMMLNIMKGAYMSLGEESAVTSFLDPIANRSMYLHFNQSWNRIFLEQDAQGYADQSVLLTARENLTSSGLFGLANVLCSESTAKQYECAWRLSDWSVVDTPQCNEANSFDRSHYKALRCLQSKDEMGANVAIGQARQQIIDEMRSASLECTHNLYKYLQRLALVQQIEDFMCVQFQRAAEHVDDRNVFDKWRLQDQIGCSDFKYKEPILAQRITIAKAAGLRAKRKLQNTFNVCADIIQSMLLHVATESRLEGKFNLAIRYLAVLNTMNTSNEIKSKLWLEDAQLNWQLNDHVMAKKLINHCLFNSEVESSLSRATALRIYGDFLADNCADNVQFLIDKYFQNSLKLLDSIKRSQTGLAERMKMTPEAIDEFIRTNQIKAFESIAKYSDREYNRVRTYMRSGLFEQKKQSVANSVRTVSAMGVSSNQTKDMKCARVVLNKNIEIDRSEIEETQSEHDQFLELAVINYLKASVLDATPKHSVMFRIIALWFSNKDNKTIGQHLQSTLSQISSYNFMAVLPQVVVRLTNSESDFSKTVSNIIERCAIDHPQQSIYQIMALANAFADNNSQLATNPEPRVLGAKKLLATLQRKNATTLVVSQMKEMCTALIGFANKDTNSKHISSKEPIRKLSNLAFVHCPTLSLPLRKSGKYDNLIIDCQYTAGYSKNTALLASGDCLRVRFREELSVHKWSDTMSLVGGINAPKKVSCLCSDGREYPQLLKAKDDLRQDAIMQQVFNILNEMLATDRTTQKRRLTIKTYKVIPLTQRSGILEWCTNSLPLAIYLAGVPGKPGAHERYHPKDLPPMDCRKIVHNYHAEKKAVTLKLEIFRQMCARFRPALQYFFLEKFQRPGEWFERRLAYTKSVATTSMIGYVLGIGDRHVSNILIDEKTAELIHIDFGIAFEQSKCLPTPENVPFRLTRDMVAAFGVSGVDGIFRKACESTLEVLRLNKTIIVTILEVLLHDPLYAWALSTKAAYSRQDIERADDDEELRPEKNIMAERALTRMEAKLNGEGTSGSTTTVEAQVEMLITDAINPYNLCRLYEGWQAYL